MLYRNKTTKILKRKITYKCTIKNEIKLKQKIIINYFSNFVILHPRNHYFYSFNKNVVKIKRISMLLYTF